MAVISPRCGRDVRGAWGLKAQADVEVDRAVQEQTPL